MMQTLGYTFALRQGVGPVTVSFLAGEDVTGFTASLKVRQNLTDVSPALTLSNGSGITLGGTDGAFSVTFSIANIATLLTALVTGTSTTGHAFYDLILTRGDGSTGMALSGDVFVSLSATH